MIFLIALKAIVLGLLVAAPVGPVGALVIRRTLRTSAWLGTATGFGAACADTLFAMAAGLGVSGLQTFFERHDRVLALGGGVLLIVWALISGCRTWKHRERKRESLSPELEREELAFQARREASYAHMARAAGGAFLITISNPVTIVGFAAAFAAFGMMNEGSVSHSVIIGGVFVGSMSWWLILAFLVRWLRSRMSKSLMFFIQLGTDGIILVSGFACLMRGFLIR